MFDGLKKKFANFISSVTNKEKEEIKKEESAQAVEEQRPVVEKPAQPQPAEPKYAKEPEPVAVPEAHIPEPKVEKRHVEEKKTEQRHEPERRINLSTVTKIKGFIFGEVRISEKDVDPFIESLKMDLLQSDVNYDVAEKIATSLHTDLVGKKINSRGIEQEIRNIIRSSLMSILSKKSSTDIISMVNEKKGSGEAPFRILFLGPNGAGKTTSMAKLAKLFLDNKLTCVMSASDTFRAAAMEQTAIHAERLGIKVIKGEYGADPSSIAFDAIAHARAQGIDVVLIDSAGRQETNKSLIEELKKITRVTKPDLKVFVGEGISGNSLLDQVKALDAAVKLDGIILTKLDVDAKGGNTLSILSETTVPVLFFGMGEKYSDLIPYDPNFILDNILS